MNNDNIPTDIPPVKDLKQAQPVASVWRPVFQRIVAAFARGDFRIKSPIPSVDVVDENTAKRIERYIAEYGQTLMNLPEEAWRTSASQWMGSHWDVLVDLWTVEAGRSDLVLSARVVETGGGFQYRVEGVYVP